MIKGKVSIIGNMNIDGDDLTGVFVECSIDELKRGKVLFGEPVVISELASQPTVPADAERWWEGGFCPDCGWEMAHDPSCKFDRTA